MLSAIYYFLYAWKYIFHPGYLKYIVFGTIISILLFMGFSFGLEAVSSILAGKISAIMPGSWAQESAVFSWLIRILGFIVLLGVFKYFVLIVMGPLLSAMSEKLELSLTQGSGQKKPLGFLTGIMRSLRLNVSNLMREWFWSFGLLFLSFVPGLAFITTPILVLLQSYYAGFGIMDFYLERHAGVRDSRKIVSRHKWFSMTLGFLFIGVFALPFIGFVLAPVLCVIAATLYLVHLEN